MKPNHFSLRRKLLAVLFILPGLFFSPIVVLAAQPQDSTFVTYSGIVYGERAEILPYAVLSVEKTNISTVTNSEGGFILKVPKSLSGSNLLVSFLGYENRRIPLTALQPKGNKIRLNVSSLTLPELEVLLKNPESIIRKMLENRAKNYSNKAISMTAFYRETIKKRNTNVSLSEALVDVYKTGYNSNKDDMVVLDKSRKSTDYTRLDTLVFKIMGGPYNNTYLDVMRHPDLFFTDDAFGSYEFKFTGTDQIDDRTVYVVGFKQRPHITTPLYYGSLFIDAESYALAKAEFDMNLTNNEEATRIFIRKKPFNAKVNATKAHYVIDYRLIGDLWYYSYSRIDLSLKINWKKKIFNTYYNSNIEMAATNWSDDADRGFYGGKNKITTSVVIQDRASGFADPEFWGEHNIIEPDKSIDNAISKIQKKLDK